MCTKKKNKRKKRRKEGKKEEKEEGGWGREKKERRKDPNLAFWRQVSPSNNIKKQLHQAGGVPFLNITFRNQPMGKEGNIHGNRGQSQRWQ